MLTGVPVEWWEANERAMWTAFELLEKDKPERDEPDDDEPLMSG